MQASDEAEDIKIADNAAMNEVLRNHPYPLPEQYASNYGGPKKEKHAIDETEDNSIVMNPSAKKEPTATPVPDKFSVEDLHLTPAEMEGFKWLHGMILSGDLNDVRDVRDAMDRNTQMKFDLFVQAMTSEMNPKVPEAFKEFRARQKK